MKTEGQEYFYNFTLKFFAYLHVKPMIFLFNLNLMLYIFGHVGSILVIIIKEPVISFTFCNKEFYINTATICQMRRSRNFRQGDFFLF